MPLTFHMNKKKLQFRKPLLQEQLDSILNFKKEWNIAVLLFHTQIPQCQEICTLNWRFGEKSHEQRKIVWSKTFRFCWLGTKKELSSTIWWLNTLPCLYVVTVSGKSESSAHHNAKVFKQAKTHLKIKQLNHVWKCVCTSQTNN